MIRIPLSEQQFDAAVKAAAVQGLELTGRGGTIEKDRVEAVWSYDGVSLQVKITSKPFWISEEYVENRILQRLGQAGKQPPPGINSTLASVVALALCFSLAFGLAGCTAQQQRNVKYAVGEIGAEIPKVQPLIQAASYVADGLLPVEAPLITGITASVQAGLTVLAALCDQYAAHPSDSIWQSIVSLVDQLEQRGATALLDAAHIVNPNSRALAQAALGTLQTALLIIDGYVQSARTPAANAAAAQARTVKLRQIAPWLDRDRVEEATGYPYALVVGYETGQGF